MSKIFESIRMKKPSFSGFDLSGERKFSCKMGQLIPILVQEILPNDKFRVQTEVQIRFAPMIAPVQHRINVFVHYFYVPNRIIWDDWEDFIGGGREGTSAPTMPVLSFTTALKTRGSLADHMGIQAVANSGAGAEPDLSQLPFRAYTQIWNDYFRDPTLDAPRDIEVTTEIDDILWRSWEKDYFTSCLPWTQRGDEVQTPFSFNPILNEHAEIWNTTQATPTLDTTAGDLTNVSGNIYRSGTGAGPRQIDNSSALGMTINDLRQTARLQEWLENNARGGYRYIEQLLHRWGVTSSDQRLNRVEYLGGGRQPVVISEVLNTSATATQPQGEMAGHGISVGMANKMSKRFEEHGWLFGIMSVLPRTNYSQGVPRWATRFDKLDYYSPEFAHLGEQAINSYELYYDPADDIDDPTSNGETFGYQQRWAEYKYGCSIVSGDYADTLDFWTLSRQFSARPQLNSTFISSADIDDRIFANQSGDDTLWCQVFNNVKAIRPMPYFAMPRL